MIEFKTDGDFQIPAVEEENGAWIIGVGTTGVKVLDQLVLRQQGVRQLLALDTDESAVRGSVVMEKILAGGSVIRGMGAGGDPELAAEVFQQEAASIQDVLRGTRLAVIVTGFGGGTGSGMVPELLDLLRESGTSTIVVAAMPFAFEGQRRLRQARQALAEVGERADAVLCFPNENLQAVTGTHEDIRENFVGMNDLLGHICMTVRSSVSHKGLMKLNVADIRQLTRVDASAANGQTVCWAAYGEGEGPCRVEDVVDNILAGPLSQDERMWVRGHAMLASLSGGTDVSMNEFQAVMDLLKERLPVDMPVMASAQIDASLGDALELTLMIGGSLDEEDVAQPVVAKVSKLMPKSQVQEREETFADLREEEVIHCEETGMDLELAEEVLEPVAVGGDSGYPEEGQSELEGFASIRSDDSKYTEQRYFNRQEELPLDKKIPRGRFEKSAPTMWNDQDLDQPTFMRMGIKIKL